MSSRIIAEKDFVSADQFLFAELSGDTNPMHMDAVAARRTMAGFPVVHGVHTLSWSLECLLAAFPDHGVPDTIQARFDKMVHVGDHVCLLLVEAGEHRLLAKMTVGGTVTAQVTLTYGARPSPPVQMPVAAPLRQFSTPQLLPFDLVEGYSGRIQLPDVPKIRATFPCAARILGTQRLMALIRTSFLVGMVCPGLNSIYSGLTLSRTEPSQDDAFTFRVVHSDIRFRLVRIAVEGAGWSGTLDAFSRPSPAPQADFNSIRKLVSATEFQGAKALIVGGSRGLGEVLGKILAAGGARVTLTYAVGETDARNVQSEIVASNGACEIAKYDARLPAKPQLEYVHETFNQIYYLATPPIFRRKSNGFVAERFADFCAFYVTGFHDLVTTVSERNGKPAAVFYPSSVAVETRPANMTEYSMAKVAGEFLCADMNSFEKLGPIIVKRLPRLPTDQTATLSHVRAEDPVTVMLPIAREVHAAAIGTQPET